jgi:hypothetical protein
VHVSNHLAVLVPASHAALVSATHVLSPALSHTAHLHLHRYPRLSRGPRRTYAHFASCLLAQIALAHCVLCCIVCPSTRESSFPCRRRYIQISMRAKCHARITSAPYYKFPAPSRCRLQVRTQPFLDPVYALVRSLFVLISCALSTNARHLSIPLPQVCPFPVAHPLRSPFEPSSFHAIRPATVR